MSVSLSLTSSEVEKIRVEAEEVGAHRYGEGERRFGEEGSAMNDAVHSSMLSVIIYLLVFHLFSPSVFCLLHPAMNSLSAGTLPCSSSITSLPVLHGITFQQ